MDIILELGGNTARLNTVVQLAQQYPDAKIIISSEGSPDFVVGFFDASNITRDRFLLDFNAWDTVTNFTTTKRLIRGYNPSKLFVVTDNFHMRRAMAIAGAVYWLSGIRLVPVPYMGSEPHDPEPDSLVRYDKWRAWLWRLTGILKYDPAVKDQRMPGIEADKQLAVDHGYPVNM